MTWNLICFLIAVACFIHWLIELSNDKVFQESGSLIIKTTSEPYDKVISKAVKIYTDAEGVVHVMHKKRLFQLPCFKDERRLMKFKEPVNATIHIIIE